MRDTTVCDEPVVPATLLLFSRLKPDCPEMASKIPPAEIDAGSQGDTYSVYLSVAGLTSISAGGFPQYQPWARFAAIVG